MLDPCAVRAPTTAASITGPGFCHLHDATRRAPGPFLPTPSERQQLRVRDALSSAGAEDRESWYDVIVDELESQRESRVATREDPVTRLRRLWPSLRDGGRYVLQGLKGESAVSVSLTAQAWTEYLLVMKGPLKGAKAASFAPALERVRRRPPPPGLSWLAAIPGGLVVGRQGSGASRGEKEFLAAKRAIGAAYRCMQGNRSLCRLKEEYTPLYGQVLLPILRTQGNRHMLEIGLGCTPREVPGRSAALWRHIFPDTTLWEAEFDGRCISATEKQPRYKQLSVAGTLQGDQGDSKTLCEWLGRIGAPLDVVIDDGGHQNMLIMRSLQHMWPALRRGGLYFAEDLQCGRTNRMDDSGGNLTVADFIEAVEDQLITSEGAGGTFGVHPDAASGVEAAAWAGRFQREVDYVFCVHPACVLSKTCAPPAGARVRLRK